MELLVVVRCWSNQSRSQTNENKQHRGHHVTKTRLLSFSAIIIIRIDINQNTLWSASKKCLSSHHGRGTDSTYLGFPPYPTPFWCVLMWCLDKATVLRCQRLLASKKQQTVRPITLSSHRDQCRFQGFGILCPSGRRSGCKTWNEVNQWTDGSRHAPLAWASGSLPCLRCWEKQRGCGKIGLSLRPHFPPLDATCPTRTRWSQQGHVACSSCFGSNQLGHHDAMKERTIPWPFSRMLPLPTYLLASDYRRGKKTWAFVPMLCARGCHRCCTCSWLLPLQIFKPTPLLHHKQIQLS